MSVDRPPLQPQSADPVAAQYERWIYPPPCYDLSQLRFDTLACAFTALRDRYWMYWPDQPFRDDLDVLVAGCGSLAAAALAHLHPRCRVLGIDISAASLAHEKLLKEKYKLANLELQHCPIEDASSLGRDFDFIACHGVLHHMRDPAGGLRALKNVLRACGVAALMVYGKYGRDGVYMLQDLFRLLSLQQRPEDLNLVKETLRLLGPQHPVRRYMQAAAGDMASDAGLVDSFLHRCDRAYTVADCLQLVRDAGLAFCGWEENALYYPDAHVPSGTSLRTALDKLPEPQIWQAVELFFGNTPAHFFYVSHPQRPPRSYRVKFDGEDFLEYIPVLRVSESSQPDPSSGRPAHLRRAPFPAVTLNATAAALTAQIDGKRTVAACVSASGLAGKTQSSTEFARSFFGSLWRLGYALFRLPPAALAGASGRPTAITEHPPDRPSPSARS